MNEFCLVARGDAILLETEAGGLDEFRRRLSRYKLRAKVTLTPAADAYRVLAAFGPGAAAALALADEPGAAGPFAGGVAYVDPRLAALGLRAVVPAEQSDTAEARLREAGFAADTAEAYDAHRLALGVADGSRDMMVDRATLLESNFDFLNGVDWEKGCYLGQELTARMHYRGLAKKRLLPVIVEGAPPPPGTAVTRDGRTVGTLFSTARGRGLALLRLDAAGRGDSPPLSAEGARIRPFKPDWAGF